MVCRLLKRKKDPKQQSQSQLNLNFSLILYLSICLDSLFICPPWFSVYLWFEHENTKINPLLCNIGSFVLKGCVICVCFLAKTFLLIGRSIQYPFTSKANGCLKLPFSGTNYMWHSNINVCMVFPTLSEGLPQCESTNVTKFWVFPPGGATV